MNEECPFFHAFLLVQFVVMVLLTPAFVAGAVAEERERNTLGDLVLTDLSVADVLRGKLLSRLADLVLLLLSGLPVLAILQLLGGVDPTLLVAAFTLTLLTMLSVGSLSLLMTVNSPRSGGAMLSAYLGLVAYEMLTLICAGSCFVTVAFPLFGSSNALVGYASLVELSEGGRLPGALPLVLCQTFVYHVLMTRLCLSLAVRSFRIQPDMILPRPPELATVPRPTLDDDGPLEWKDAHFPQGGDTLSGADALNMWTVLGCCFAVTFSIAGLIAWEDPRGDGHREVATVLTNVLLPAFVSVGVLRLLLRAAGTISRERENQTLDTLLTTPLTNEEILRGKWRGCLQGQTGQNLMFALFLGGSLLVGAASLPGVVLAGLDGCVQVGLALSLGMWCSVSARSTFRAVMAAVLWLLALGVGHWLIYLALAALMQLSGRSDLVPALTGFHLYGLTPPVRLSSLVTVDGDGPDSWFRLSCCLAGMSLHATLAIGLWLRVCSRFRALTGRVC